MSADIPAPYLTYTLRGLNMGAILQGILFFFAETPIGRSIMTSIVTWGVGYLLTKSSQHYKNSKGGK